MLDVMIRVHVSIITLISPIIYMASPNFQHQNTGLASCSVWLIRPPLSGNKSIPRCGVRQLSLSLAPERGNKATTMAGQLLRLRREAGRQASTDRVSGALAAFAAAAAGH